MCLFPGGCQALFIYIFFSCMLHSISSFSPPFSSPRGHQLFRNFPLSPCCRCLLHALGSGWIVRDIGEIQPLTSSPFSLVCRLASPSPSVYFSVTSICVNAVRLLCVCVVCPPSRSPGLRGGLAAHLCCDIHSCSTSFWIPPPLLFLRFLLLLFFSPTLNSFEAACDSELYKLVFFYQDASLCCALIVIVLFMLWRLSKFTHQTCRVFELKPWFNGLCVSRVLVPADEPRTVNPCQRADRNKQPLRGEIWPRKNKPEAKRWWRWTDSEIWKTGFFFFPPEERYVEIQKTHRYNTRLLLHDTKNLRYQSSGIEFKDRDTAFSASLSNRQIAVWLNIFPKGFCQVWLPAS